MVICIEQLRARIGLFVAASIKGTFAAHNDLNIVRCKVSVCYFWPMVKLKLIHDLNEEEQIIFHVIIGL